MAPEPAETVTQDEPSTAAPDIVIGIGASAGGVGALRQFFMRVPESSRAAFVIVLHLSPDHESHLPEVLAAVTPLPVVRVTDRTLIESGHLYVVPPNRSLTIEDGHIAVAPLTTPEQRYAPVDLLLRTLAQSHGSGAVAVILSGTGANGSNGIKWIKEHGGLVLVQDPAEAEFADMPRNSLATGLVDYQLPVAAMPEAIFRYYSQPLPVPRFAAAAENQEAERDALRELLTLLRVKTGHDFSNYKPGTVYRRIARRMHVHNLGTVQDYVRLMRESSGEAALLLNELLISVTAFFRDPDAYEALYRRVVPQLFAHRNPPDQVRVWVAGCATGEEAYSIAILLAEYASTVTGGSSVQLFATDLDVRAIGIAREGFYTDAEVADVSEERLRRFFLRDGPGYRVRRELRETVLFAHHNLIKDPPFSHLDLIVCRNVMIYLNRSVQQRLAETFHFALRPGGYLFVGSSESLDNANDLFAPLDRAAHIYESRTVASRVSSAIPDAQMLTVAKPDGRFPPARAADRQSAADLHQRLLEQYAPPSLVVTEDYQVVHVSDSAARYLTVSGGEPTRDLMKMIRPELRADLRTAMHQALRQRTTAEVRDVELTDPERARVTICVRPALREGDPPRGYLLVLFAPQTDQPTGEAGIRLNSPTEAPVTQLEAELEDAKRRMTATVEDYESHAEEMRAANEELQAMNEELRSAAEELETSKEELQSVNEELTTVNQELKIKIEELAHTNNDFQNFINATDVGTLFLDRTLRVKLFTARATDLFHLLPTDVGRPLAHITSTLRSVRLEQEIGLVFERLSPLEREVQAEDGRSYLMRILPYRTTDDRIEGVVISFVDITTRVRAEEALKLGEQRFRLLIDGAVDYAIFTVMPDGTIDFWNAGAQRMFGYAGSEVVGHPATMLLAPERQHPSVALPLGTAAAKPHGVARATYVRKDGSRIECSSTITRLGDGTQFGFAWTVRDLTSQLEAAVALTRANAGLEERVAARTRELTAEVTRRTEAQDHVTKLMQKLVTSQEEQRARIARDLHDQLGQQLTALRLALERFRDRHHAADRVDADLDRALALTYQIDTEVDFLAWELRPAMLDDLGLSAALPEFVRDWSAHYGIPTEVRTSGLTSVDPPREVEVTFYRIAQEALNNVVKHAHPSRADVILEARDGSLVLVVEDDGVGFDPQAVESTHGIGLLGMRERASLIGGTLDIESSPGHGTSVFLRCPVPVKSDGEAAV